MAMKLATTVAVKMIDSQRWICRIQLFQFKETSLDRWRPALPTRQLSDLNEVAASVVELGDGRAGDLGRRHLEFTAALLDALVVTLDVVGEEHDCRLALLEQGLLIRIGRRVVVERELQVGSV